MPNNSHTREGQYSQGDSVHLERPPSGGLQTKRATTGQSSGHWWLSSLGRQLRIDGGLGRLCRIGETRARLSETTTL